MSKIGQAIAIAAEVHKDQVDKAGVPYIYHVLEVAKRAEERYDILYGYRADDFGKEDVIITAWLHDVVEDFKGRPGEHNQLRDKIYRLFGDRVYQGVDGVTKRPEESYEQRIERASKDWISRLVKLCDLSHNMEAWRIPSGEITEKDFARWDKYHRAFVRLMKED